jgi:hypothetical protein
MDRGKNISDPGKNKFNTPGKKHEQEFTEVLGIAERIILDPQYAHTQ